MNNKEKGIFYQSKFEYFRKTCISAVILSVIAEFAFLYSDYLIIGSFPIEALVPRMFMFLPLVFFLYVVSNTKNYKVVVPLMYVMLHGIMWCTIWAIVYLPTTQHANEGFTIMHLMFLAVGLCAPIKWSVPAHAMLLVDIIVSYPLNNYEGIFFMMSTGIPVFIAMEIMLFVLEKSYVDHYNIRKQLQNLSYHDQLTNAYNRNKLDQLCGNKQNILPFTNGTILILDIDFFKKINDTYGHGAGDEVLQKLVKILSENVRNNDYVIRWGGEEFIILLPECNIYESYEVAERIRRSVENYEDACCKFTISVGLTRYDGNDYNNSIKNADKALYYSKEHGRNKVSVYERLRA